MPSITILGSGIIGLSSAIRIQRELPHEKITLIAEKFSPETTSDIAAGIWGPYLVGGSSEDVKWSSETFTFLNELWQDGSRNYGVSMVPCYRVSRSNTDYSKAVWKDTVFGFRLLNGEELSSLSKRGHKSGCSFTTFTVEASKLLPILLEEFKRNGGVVIQRRVNNIEELRDIVVNCTGLGARELVGDVGVVAVRGQVMRVTAPWIKFAFLEDDEDGNYVIPNQESVVLGGTHQEGDWCREVYPEDTEFIRTGCGGIVEGIEAAPVIREIVGLRPGRSKGVKIDLEVRRKDGKPLYICSNYGHGGSGLTLFWGCAGDTVGNVREAMGRMKI